MVKRVKFKLLFKVITSNKEGWKGECPIRGDLWCTDGSKMNSRAGSGTYQKQVACA